MYETGGTPASERLYYIAHKWARRLSYIPYVRGIILCGSVHKKTASYDSDIDFVIISNKNRAWLVHAQMFVYLSLFNMRRTKKVRKEKICVNATFSEDSADAVGTLDGELLWSGTSRTQIIEKICNATRISDVCESIARNSISAFVERKFLAHKKSRSALLNTAPKHVQYYPPRIQSVDSVAARKAHS